MLVTLLSFKVGGYLDMRPVLAKIYARSKPNESSIFNASSMFYAKNKWEDITKRLVLKDPNGYSATRNLFLLSSTNNLVILHAA